MTTDNVYVGVMTFYDGSGQSLLAQNVGNKRALATYVTGAATTANVWSKAHAAGGAISSQNGQLNTGHFYALKACYVQDANGVAVKFVHADFKGNTPGGMIARTASHRKAYLDFMHHGALPVFSASSPLDIYVYSEGTNTPIIVVELIDLGKGAEGATPGVEDFNLAMKAVTDGAGLELLAVVAGDTLTIKDGHGQPYLCGYFITGTAPLRGQLTSTDKALQPNPIEIQPHCTLAGDYLNEIIRYERPLLTPNSLIDTYGSS